MLNMQRLPRISVVIGVFSLPLILGNAKNQLQPEFPDVGKIFEGFRAGLALSDIDNDGDLDCLTATQVDYNASVESATYVWHLQAVNGHEARDIYFYVRPGDALASSFSRTKMLMGLFKRVQYSTLTTRTVSWRLCLTEIHKNACCGYLGKQRTRFLSVAQTNMKTSAKTLNKHLMMRPAALFLKSMDHRIVIAMTNGDYSLHYSTSLD
ncbi:uncharacterized protein LOC142572781 isoform X1 [Dermacentor variabilis]|uniref:uncharacterized protein LOC142572781 isoform X1 n=1 Tax=Dermacentor variabilis TaxID=34621 RepID=UPI003F5C0D09